MSEFAKYRRRQIAELRPYIAGEVLHRVSISPADNEAGSPKVGDMIARNPANHDDQWLVAKDYFAVNFEPVDAQAQDAGPNWKNGDRVEWTNELGNTFTGTLETSALVKFDSGGWRTFAPWELKDLRALAAKEAK